MKKNQKGDLGAYRPKGSKLQDHNRREVDKVRKEIEEQLLLKYYFDEDE